jgi:hypothetical protein
MIVYFCGKCGARCGTKEALVLKSLRGASLPEGRCELHLCADHAAELSAWVAARDTALAAVPTNGVATAAVH